VVQSCSPRDFGVKWGAGRINIGSAHEPRDLTRNPDALAGEAQREDVSIQVLLQRLMDEHEESMKSANGATSRRPISEVIREIRADMPEDVRSKLPRDGASQADHYVYRLPKRDL
jgi:hypothetical protein